MCSGAAISAHFRLAGLTSQAYLEAQVTTPVVNGGRSIKAMLAFKWKHSLATFLRC